MKVNFVLSALVFALVLPAGNAQEHSPRMGVVVQSTEENAEEATTTVHLVNVSGKEVTAFSLSMNRTLPDGKIFAPSSSSYDFLGEYLSNGAMIRKSETQDVLSRNESGAPRFS